MEDPEQRKNREKELRKHPKAKSNFLAHFLFCWEIPIIWRGWRNNHNYQFQHLEEYESKKITDRFEELWEAEISFSKKPSLWRCIWRQFGLNYLLFGIIYAPFEVAVTLELNKIETATNFRMIVNAFKVYMGKLCVFLSVLFAVVFHKDLTSQYVFSLISIYEYLKITAVIMLPLATTMLAEARISVQRIQKFLSTDIEIKTKHPCLLKSHQFFTQKPSQVVLKNVSAKWDYSLAQCALDNVDFEAYPGELIGIIGSAGSGKSTLLHTILKELNIIKGLVDISGSISYASQEAWIFPASIRQNILFGEAFDLNKYQKVIRVCALERDLTLFPSGDQTLVGERGALLSGGQKARINLARAVYKNSDIYLLDDPLSAVDAHVARHIFEDCISGYLENKVVVLVTHQVHFLQQATKIYRMMRGEVADVGSYKQIVGGKHEFENISSEPQTIIVTDHDMKEELKEHQNMKTTSKAYKGYCLAAGGWVFTVIMVIFFCFGQLFTSAHDLFLTFWTNLEQNDTFEGFFTTQNCLYVYIVVTLSSFLMNHLAAYIFTRFCMSASATLHKQMLAKIIFGPMLFFNHNPSGRLLNRFSKDLGSIDELLPIHLMNGITAVLTGVAVILIIVIVNFWMVIPSILLVALTILFTKIFQPTNRNVKRAEGINRSSIFTQMATTIQGLATIRAQKVQNKLKDEFDNQQNIHSSSYYLFTATFAAFGFWTDFMAAVYTLLVIFSFFFLSGTYAGNVGLAITQSINLLGMVQYGVKTFGELDSQMTSVERVVEYANLVPEEDSGNVEPPESWPSTGRLSFKEVSLKYTPNDPPVLKEVSFDVQPGEKIGIVGRTGAGKTSLISVLFRLFNFDGSIILDGYNSKSLPLKSLRSKISIIPQEPILFLGSLRKNLDPFDNYTDKELWGALEELNLKDMSNLSNGLESAVTERGSNFSVGQRQLLCLIRAMLKNSKIIVLDEATANVDLETDQLIQSVIRKKFKSATVLIIAHRLKTIIDSDKVLVMDGGKVVEFGHPYKLLQNPNGYFYSLVQKNGNQMLAEFLKIAKSVWNK